MLMGKDLFIRPEYRRTGVGQMIFKTVLNYAIVNQYKRFDFHVLNWNKRACDFYESLGAVDVSKNDEWTLFRKVLN